MRVPGAIFDTHIMTIKGLFTGSEMVTRKVDVDVRFTSDSHETLSLTFKGMQIMVPFDKVMKLVEETRSDSRREYIA